MDNRPAVKDREMRSLENLTQDYQQLLKDRRMFNVDGWQGYCIDLMNYHKQQDNGLKLTIKSSRRRPLLFNLKLDNY